MTAARSGAKIGRPKTNAWDKRFCKKCNAITDHSHSRGGKKADGSTRWNFRCVPCHNARVQDYYERKRMTASGIVSSNKDLQTMAKLARQQGWTVELSPGGHVKWTPPMGEFYMSSSTPSKQRTVHNVTAALVGMGLVTNRAEEKRMTRGLAEASNELLETYGIHEHSGDRNVDKFFETILKRVDAVWGPVGDGEHAVPFGMENRLLVYMVLDKFIIDGKPVSKCACKRTYAHVHGFVRHVATCSDAWSYMTNKKEPGVDRNLQEPPPLRERLTCAECPFYCWITQPHIMAAHMASEHGKMPCPHCGEFFMKARGGLSRHVRACEKNNGAPAGPSAPEEVAPVVQIDRKRRDPVVVPAGPAIEEVPIDVVEDDDEPEHAKPPVSPAHPSQAKPKARKAPKRTADTTDEELWALLELVLDGPIQVGRESFAAINDWMDATRRLIDFKAKQES